MSETQPTRREVMHKALYVAPVILTLPALAAFASAGSGDEDHQGSGDEDHQG